MPPNGRPASPGQASLAQAESRLQQIGEASLPLAEQSLRQAEANARQAERQYQRVGELVAKGFYSPAQLDDAQRARDVAASQLQAAQIQAANNRPQGSEVRRPQQCRAGPRRAGRGRSPPGLRHAARPGRRLVLTRSVEPGDTAQPGKALLTLAPNGDTEPTAQIDEKNFGLLALGQNAHVSADAYPGEHFPATLSYIAPSIDALRGSVEIRLAVPQPPATLRHEMTVSIDIEAARRPDALSLPPATARRSRRPAVVMAVRDGRTVRQPVKSRPARRRALRGGRGPERRRGCAAGQRDARRRPPGGCGQPEIRANIENLDALRMDRRRALSARGADAVAADHRRRRGRRRRHRLHVGAALRPAGQPDQAHAVLAGPHHPIAARGNRPPAAGHRRHRPAPAKQAQRLRAIDQWQTLRDRLETWPEIAAVSPVAAGPAFAVRGEANKAITVVGIEPERYNRVISLAERADRRAVAGRRRRGGDRHRTGQGSRRRGRRQSCA